MLIHLPVKRRSEEDESAPVDYSFVGSVAEGTRRQQSAPIHPEPDRAAVRHRADPNAPADPAQSNPPLRSPVRRDGMAVGAATAYPRPRSNGFAHTPAYEPLPATPLDAAQAHRQTPAAPVGRAMPERPSLQERGGPTPPTPMPVTSAMPDRASATRASVQPPADGSGTPQQQRPVPVVQPGDLLAPDGSHYAPPPAAPMPEWLRLAQQNNLPMDADRRRRTPRVETAPQQPPEPPPTDMLGRPIARRTPPPRPQNQLPTDETDYEAAGYPPELIEQMRRDAVMEAQNYGYGRKRHGAMVAAPQPAPNRMGTSAVGRVQPRPSAPRPTREEAYPDYAPPRNGYYPQQPGAADAEPPYPGRPRADFAPRGRRTAPPADLPPRADAPDPWQEPADSWEDAPGDEPAKLRLKIPYLGIAGFAAAMLVILLWILQTTFTAQRVTLLADRATAATRLADNHPFDYRELIEREAAANNLHPAFVAAIVLNESSFNPQAESNVGARGLMQMMPDTAAWVHEKMGRTDEYSFDQMYDPETNVEYACWYLAFLGTRFHDDPVLVSAAFHAGQTTVQNWLNDSRYSNDNQTIRLEDMAEGPTKNYATRVLKAFAVYRRLYYEGGLTASAAETPAS
ncbi:MAG: transglycosylase SLT domain-containing protein [Candidatus Limiplasma sp.]|nr:transglycosylase SLT domain-containing protein [Candidatus Limiplasma sp.]